MIRKPRWAALALLAVLATACSTSEGGTAVTGGSVAAAPSNSAGVRPMPPSSVPLSSAAPITVSSALSTSAPVSTAVVTVTATTTATPTPPTSPSVAPTATVQKTTAPKTPPTTHRTAPTSKPVAPAAFPVCPGVSAANVNAIVSCLKSSVSDFWSGQLNEVVDQDVIVAPTAAQVPAECRPALTSAPAFTCQINDTVYINQSFLDLVIHEFGANDIPYALASIVSHEIGHVVQAAVKQPGYNQTGSSNTISKQIEQQADCLSGVWAYSQAIKGKGFDTKTFETVAKQLITDVSSNPEINTHGTPDQRAAAILQGLSTGTPQGCKLATFS